MRYLTLLEASRIYTCSSRFKMARHVVKHPELHGFCITLRNFERMLGEEAKDIFWRALLQRLRRYRFEVCAAPLPFNHPAVYTAKLMDLLNRAVSECRMIYPSFLHPLQDLATRIKRLAESGANPLLEFLDGFCAKSHSEETALLLREPRLIPFTEKTLSENTVLRNLSLVNAHQLRGEARYDRIITIGPVRWFPEYVLGAPRATEIHIVCYRWIMDKWEPQSVFVSHYSSDYGEKVSQRNYKGGIGKTAIEPETLSVDSYLDSDELLPKINWEEISARLSRVPVGDTAGTSQETVDAKLFLLEGGAAVFLDENARVLVIDLEEDEDDNETQETRVKRIQASGIQPGMYILLRTSGGGEYIIPVADRILDKLAYRARQSQRHWKELLRSAVYSRGLQEVVNALRALGCTRANEVNIRNWMSMRNIRPQAYRDFVAIMKFLKLEEKIQEYWKLARAVDDAHKRAGFYIRKLLLKQVLTANLDDLEKTGKMDFELPEADGGSLTAFRVTDISPGQYTVPVTRIGHPFERDEDGNGENDSTLSLTGMQ
ncbi:MAG: hypothetical protein H5U02_04930 [Clostridia bacterium]|nr:hypothetical protein [Clostridia bacterium]